VVVALLANLLSNLGLFQENSLMLSGISGVLQLVGSVWPDDEGVVRIMKPAEGLVGSQVKRPLLEILHIEVGSDLGQWRAHGHTIDLFLELAIEAEV
jgi:hypothetical protein